MSDIIKLIIKLIIISFAAGVVSGLAMLVALIWLKESHPLLVDENGKQIRKKVEQASTGSSEGESFLYEYESSSVGKKTARVKPRITPLILMCFVNEFCVKWTINAFDSRYGIYLTDRWNVSSPVFSYVFQSLSKSFKIII